MIKKIAFIGGVLVLAVALGQRINPPYSAQATASGPAGGDLTGNYPNPTIAHLLTARPIFAQVANATVGNTTSELTLIASGVDYTGSSVSTITLPANFFFAGKSIKVRVMGYHSATGNPNITPRIKIGGSTVLTTTVASQSSTQQAFVIEAWITCRTAGAMGTIIGQGTYTETGNFAVGLTNTATTTVDTTGTLAVDVTLQWGAMSLSDTATATNATVENSL